LADNSLSAIIFSSLTFEKQDIISLGELIIQSFDFGFDNTEYIASLDSSILYFDDSYHLKWKFVKLEGHQVLVNRNEVYFVFFIELD